nr:immunoglobulin light chain junction region [Macaca mulatta]MOY03593.1 immunoglobulin light chain junction region [Macaca mulatta]
CMQPLDFPPFTF